MGEFHGGRAVFYEDILKIPDQDRKHKYMRKRI